MNDRETTSETQKQVRGRECDSKSEKGEESR